MKKRFCRWGRILALTLSAHGSAWAGNAWSNVTQPASAKSAQAIGQYTAGCLAGAQILPPNGPGFQVMRLSRHRYFGHPVLIDFIQTLGQQVARQGLGALMIGDLGQARGGPMPYGHRSHQAGLDVDIWFWDNPIAVQRILNNRERETLNAPSVVLPDGLLLDPYYWHDHNAEILQLAAEHPAVERIFVNAAVKKRLCDMRVPHRDHRWLRKIRPWWAHQDHFHVRLYCPPNNPYCVPQEQLPTGEACDASLDWWLQPANRHPKPAKHPPPPLGPVLPTLCERVLHNQPID